MLRVEMLKVLKFENYTKTRMTTYIREIVAHQFRQINEHWRIVSNNAYNILQNLEVYTKVFPKIIWILFAQYGYKYICRIVFRDASHRNQF